MKRSLSLVLVLALVIGMFSVFAISAGAEDTTAAPEAPTEPTTPTEPTFPEGAVAIATAEEFAAMEAGKYYYLTADITVAATYETDFTGTFDGNGHTVTFTVSAHGLFGNTDWSAVIKNVAFKNLTTAAAKDHGDQVILCNLPYGAFEDVYISFADFDSVNRGHRTALFSNPSGNTVKMTRVIIDIPDASVDAVDYESGTKSYYGPISLYGTAAKDFTVTGSVYVIAKFMPMISCGFSGKAYYMYAVNDYKEGESASTTHKVLNSYRYDTVADMKADTTNYDATGFTASVWQNVNI